MKLLSRIFGSPTTYQMRIAATAPVFQELHPRELYKLLDGYYLNNGLYDTLALTMYESAIWKEALKGLRNPAKRTVEFHVAHLWAGALPEALPIKADNKRIMEPVQQVWAWSNWGAKKQLAARNLAKLGDLFIKVVQLDDQVYFQLIDPYYVTDFMLDHRDFVTYIQIDIPQERRTSSGETESFTHTEIWEKDQQRYRLWQHEDGIGVDPNQLGAPQIEKPLSEFKINFVPFVHAKFMDIGEKRGCGAFTLELDKIDEVNRKATRLAQMIFRYNKALWALRANAQDASGRPLPPPRVGGETGDASTGDTIELGDDRMIRLPGLSTIESLVPDINYQAHLDALKADLEELEQDLPEMAFYRLREIGNLSGRALQILLAGAVDKALEARGNAETALARADAMALTMGQNAGLFDNLGNYEAGDFEHSFEERDVIKPSELDLAEEGKIYVEMGVPLKSVLRRQGWSKADLKDVDTELEQQRSQEKETLAAAVLRAQRAMDAGQQSNGAEGAAAGSPGTEPPVL